MRKLLIYIILFNISFCATGLAGGKQYFNYSETSGFDVNARLCNDQKANLTLLTRTWGFVKYHHPVFFSSDINADFEFFELLPQVFNASSNQTKEILNKWIHSLGDYRSGNYKLDTLVVINDFSWINDTQLLGADLSKELQNLRFAARDSNFYVEQTPIHVLFNEKKYIDPQISQTDIGYRLLGVARYWNIVDHFSPNRNITDTPWDEVLPEFIELACDKNISGIQLLSRLISRLDDTHANTPYISIFGNRIVPLLTKIAEDRMFITEGSLIGDNCFCPGDEIISVNGTSVADKISQTALYTSNSNHDALTRNASYMSLLTNDTTAQLVFRRNDNTKNATVPTSPFSEFGERIFQNYFTLTERTVGFLDDSIAYINIAGLTTDNSKQVFDSIRAYPKLIIDMRKYPAEYGVKTEFFQRYFIREQKVFVTTYQPVAVLPGYFSIYNEYNAEEITTDEKYQGKIIVLVNCQTQSMAEYFVMLLQTLPNTLTIGSTTAGADGNISEITLPFGVNTCITGLGAYYPDGVNAQRTGVKIDRVVNQTAEGIKAGLDEVLQEAIKAL